MNKQWYKEKVFYQIWPRSFKDGNGDGMEAFKKVLDGAHERGMKVIMDLVVNHTSDQHEWFQKSRQRIDPYTDYYIWRPKKPNGKLPNNWDSSWQNVFLKGTPFIYQGQEIGMSNWYPNDPKMYEDVQTRWQYENVATKKSPEKRLQRLWHGSRDSARTPVQWDM